MEADPDSKGNRRWWVRCTCRTVTIVSGIGLSSGTRNSCGCLAIENGSKQGKKYGPLARSISQPRRGKYINEAIDRKIATNCDAAGKRLERAIASGYDGKKNTRSI